MGGAATAMTTGRVCGAAACSCTATAGTGLVWVALVLPRVPLRAPLLLVGTVRLALGALARAAWAQLWQWGAC